jgi:hypothetical protein
MRNTSLVFILIVLTVMLHQSKALGWELVKDKD